MGLLSIALAPVIIIAIYIYYRDKYEKEPIKLLLLAFISGAIITFPIVFVEQYLTNYWQIKFTQQFPSDLTTAFYSAFVVAAFTEELFKYLIFWILIWGNKNFNEKFDGIIYAVFISLGFAMVENVLYVFQHGYGIGILRAITAVPAHTIFAIAMGYYLGLAKFNENKSVNIIKALIYPIILHGLYDFTLMSNKTFLLIAFVFYLLYLYATGHKKMKRHSEASIFKSDKTLN